VFRGRSPGPAPRYHGRVMATDRSLVVREMQLSEAGVRIDYFHDSSDDQLRRLGVDRAFLLREEWRSAYEEDGARPIEQRATYSLIWELDGETVGFSSADRITFGQEAFMHLHVVKPDLRRQGLGARLVQISARHYFRALELQRLFCEPNALNVAPNRTLQRAGFRYLFTHECRPGPMNFFQATTRWVLERPDQP
jgi:RimJ/RimL family protein N-acetyltransferase